MAELLFQHPMLICLTGFGIAGIALFVWVQAPDLRAQRVALYSGCLVLVLTFAMILLSVSVKTDAELISSTLYEMAATVENNDLDSLQQYVHPNASETLRRASQALQRFTFNEARVTRVKQISTNADQEPRTAIAEFNAVAEVALDDGRQRAARFVRVYMMRKDDRWLINDFEHFEPSAGFRNTSLTSPGP